MAELAESYDPSDDDEIPGQDALWEPSVAQPAAQWSLPTQTPVIDDEPAAAFEPSGFERPSARPDNPSRSATPGSGTSRPATPEPDATRPGTAQAATSRAARSQPATSRPSGIRVSVSPTGRGVTGRGVVVLVTAFTAVVGVIDVIASGHRGHLFGIAFVLAAMAGAYLVRRRDLLIAVVAPPLIYCVLIFFMSLIDSGGSTGSLATRIGVYIGDAFVTGAPSIWVGTAAAAAVVWWRTGGTLRRLPPALNALKDRRKN